MSSIFSGKAGRNSAIWTAGKLQDQLGELQGIYGTGKAEADKWIGQGYDASMADLEQYYPQSRDDWTSGLTAANQSIMQGRDASLGAISSGYGQAINAAGQYYGQGASTLQGAAANFDPLIASGMKGLGMYENSLGLNGAEGRQAARDAFQTGPGYEWQVDQAVSGAQRAANKIGGAFGGNASQATTTLASNLANQEYGNWQKNLQGFQGAAQNAVSGQAGVLNNLATLYQNQGNTTSSLYANQGKDTASIYANAATGLSGNQMTTAQGLSNLAAQQGQNLASLDTNYGQSMANNALGYMQNLAGANSNYYSGLIPAGQQGMMAGQQAAANRTGALMGGLQMGMQALGGAAGGGGLFSKLWS